MSRPDIIPLEDYETALLIRAAATSPGRVVDMIFGFGGAALNPDGSPWAVPLLEEWRGLTFTDGGGI